MSDPSYPAYPILAFFASFLVLIPLSWHWQAWNAGTCLYMIWTALACMNFGVNSIIWRDNAINIAPVWCDISSRIIVASSVALPASSLCIVRRLHNIATMRTVGITIDEKRKAIYVDLAIGLGIPILQLVMQYIVSGHRFDIFEEIGCYPFTYNTPVAYPLSFAWPVAIGVVSLVYCLLTLRAFIRRRALMNALFASTALTASRYLRLMLLTVVESLCTIPIASYGMSLNISSGIQSWVSWSDTHWGYSYVGQYPSILWKMDRTAVVTLELTRCLPIFCAFVFFGFFGFAEEARRNYSRMYNTLGSCYSSLRQWRLLGVLKRSSRSPVSVSLAPVSSTSMPNPKCEVSSPTASSHSDVSLATPPPRYEVMSKDSYPKDSSMAYATSSLSLQQSADIV